MHRCDYPGCEKQATCTWQSLKGRLQTCAEHQCVEPPPAPEPAIAWYKEPMSKPTQADIHEAIQDHADDHMDEGCWNCGGEGFIYMCLDEIGCIDPEGGCDLCERRCDICKPGEKRKE